MEKIKQEDLAYELVDYMKDFDYYEFKDVYNSEDDAYRDMLDTLEEDKISSTLEWLSNNILYIAQEKDMSDSEMKRLSDNTYNLIFKVNKYSNQLNKDIEL